MKHPHFTTTPKTSMRMAHVHLKHGKAETMLAKALWHSGYRYRLNYKKLPGSPDIAIVKFKIAIFVDGEFWHGKDWENHKTKIKTNKEYWAEKINENIARDKKNDLLLQSMNWTVFHFWEKDVLKNLEDCLLMVISTAKSKQTAYKE